MAQPQLIQIALESGSHNAIGVDKREESGAGAFNGPRAGRNLSSGKACAPSSCRAHHERDLKVGVHAVARPGTAREALSPHDPSHGVNFSHNCIETLERSR